MSRITVEARTDLMGNLLVAPIRADIRNRIAGHMEEWTGHRDAQAFIPEHEVEEFLRTDVPARHHFDLRRGWTVRFRMDPWLLGHLYGWDAHTLFE
jgi:hypothetical protein